MKINNIFTKLLNMIPFYMIVYDNAVGRISRIFGIVGTENAKDMIPFHIVYGGRIVLNTVFYISFLGLVQVFSERVNSSGKNVIRMKWLIYLPFSLCTCKCNSGRLFRVSI